MNQKRQSPVGSFVWYLWCRHPFRMTVLVLSMVAVSLSEGVGVALLLPLLSLIGLGESSSSGPGRLTQFLAGILQMVGLRLNLENVLLLFFLVVTAENVLRFLQRSYGRKFLGDFGADLRVLLYEAYLNASWPFWLHKHIGHMASLLTAEAKRVEAAFYHLLFIMSDSIMILVLFGFAFSISWRLTLLFLVGGAILLFAMRGLVRAGNRAGSEISAQNNALQEVVQEHLNAAKLIKSSGMEKQSLEAIQRSVRQLNKAEIDGAVGAYRVASVFSPMLAAILGLGLYAALKYFHITPVQILVILYIFYRVSPKMAGLQQSWHGVLLNVPAHEAILSDLEEAARSVEEEQRRQVASCPFLSQAITLESVSFAYRPGVPVISKVSLSIPAGRTVGLVGESGSGKSTLFDLVLGLLKPTVGTIRVDGVDLCDIDLSAWRKQIGYVGQETMLFYDTIRNNICWANPEANEKEIEEAAKLAYVHDFVVAMPEGYETTIGARGIRLSGGERQRIALACALVRHPRLLVLDEATSNLDAVSEMIVQEAIDTLRSQMTIIIVAHRLATVRNADWIYVIEHGRIVQEGTWEQLSQSAGPFYELWSVQSGAVQG